MSRPSSSAGPDAPREAGTDGQTRDAGFAVPVAGWVSWPPAARPWSAWAEARADLRAALGLAAGLVLTGIPAGLLWWALAPRADFRVTADGPMPIGRPSGELRVGDDAVLVLLLAGLGLLAGTGVWLLRRRRGVATLAALAVGTAVAAVLAWQIGELLGTGPSRAQLADVGSRVTTGLTLGSLPALAVAPFAAVVAYLVGTLSAPTDDLGRAHAPSTRSGQPLVHGNPAPVRADDTWLLDAPPPGRPAG